MTATPTPAPVTVDTVHTLAAGQVDTIYGPPGTGKTTLLAERVFRTALQRGNESMALMSFTNTAAEAIRGRAAEKVLEHAAAIDDPIERERVVREATLPHNAIGTLHSFGYRAIGHPDCALDPKIISEWNRVAPAEWSITVDGRRSTPDMAADAGMLGGTDEDVTGETRGDALLGALDLQRASLTPEGDWPVELRTFAERWDAWKREVEAVDFGDMINGALARALDGEACPGNPQVIIGDEMQDMTPAEVALMLAWGRRADRLVLAGDDDQAINEWRGGNVAPILALASNDHLELTTSVLDQSYRIPSSVHSVAERWIARVGQRAKKAYRPRVDQIGQAYSSGATIGDPRLLHRIEKDIDAGRSVMVIASCGYMLNGLIGNLRNAGIPFHNQYRPAEPRWNPLKPAPRGLSAAERLYRYLVLDERQLGEQSRLWTGEDVRAWFPMLLQSKAGLRRGSGKIVENLPAGEVPYQLIASLFDDEASLGRATEPDIEWLMGALAKAYERRLVFPANVVRARGITALTEKPMVTIGTVHSVKGGEADVVYICPDLSSAGASQWYGGGGGKDQVTRLFYVALTRARQRVCVLSSANRFALRRRLLIPQDLEVRDAA